MKDLASSLQNTIDPDASRPEVTELLMRGVCRGLGELGYATLTEFTLGCGRRADVMGLDPRGEIVIVEVKSGLDDYRADHKWQDYMDYCDRFFFAVSAQFPKDLLPAECGLLVADGFGAVIQREAPTQRLNAARRRAESLRFARAAADRLQGLIDPR